MYDVHLDGGRFLESATDLIGRQGMYSNKTLYKIRASHTSLGVQIFLWKAQTMVLWLLGQVALRPSVTTAGSKTYITEANVSDTTNAFR